MLISIEIMLLAITFLILVSSASFDDILGQTYAIYIISIAGAESAIGLGILVAFYRLNFSLISTGVHNNNKIYTKNVNKRKINFLFVILKGTKSYSKMAKINYIANQCISCSIDPLFTTGVFDAESSFFFTIKKL
jgi:NADH:ubiquinone oxidoreductase subunit K